LQTILTMNSSTSIFKNLKTQDNETRLDFYERLGFNLTIAIRSIWSDTHSSDKDTLERIKIINEISHRVYHWIWRLRRDDINFDDLDCALDIKTYTDHDRVLVGELSEAIRSSYEFVISSKNEPR
jgi:hypothetical protein